MCLIINNDKNGVYQNRQIFSTVLLTAKLTIRLRPFQKTCNINTMFMHIMIIHIKQEIFFVIANSTRFPGPNLKLTASGSPAPAFPASPSLYILHGPSHRRAHSQSITLVLTGSLYSYINSPPLSRRWLLCTLWTLDFCNHCLSIL